MDDVTNDNHKPLRAPGKSPPAAGVNGEDTPLAENEAEALADGAPAEPVPTPEPTGVTPEPASVQALMSDTEEEEHYSKAQLLEFGRQRVREKKAARWKARERAAQERAMGLLTISCKVHKNDRRLTMGVIKALLRTVEKTHKANLPTKPMEEAVLDLLRDFYKSAAS